MHDHDVKGAIDMSIYELLKMKESYLVLYILVINTIGFMMTVLDKYYAKKHRWRIAEKSFFVIAMMGGAAGVVAGMKIFRHKTLHKSFAVGMPLLFIINLGCLFIFIYTLYLK